MGTGVAGVLLASCAPAATEEPVVPTKQAVPTEPTVEDVNGLKISDFTKANVDWSQFKGTSLNVLMLSSPPATDYWKDAMKVFETLSGATVTVTELAQNELNDRRFADMVSGAGNFDLINSEFNLIPGYVEANFVESLDPYIEDSNKTDKAWLDLGDIYEGIYKAGAWKDEQYALPTTSESTVLSYRKDLISEPPQTFEDLMAMAEQAYKPGEMAGFVARAQRGEGMNVYVWTGFLKGFGGKFFADFPNDYTPVINSPEAIAAAEFYAEILNKYGPDGIASYTNEETQLDAQNNKAASLIEWSGHPILIDNPENSETSGKWAFAQVPSGPGGRWPAVFSWVWAINAGSKNKDATWALLQAVASPPAQLHNSAGLIVPIRESVAKSDFYIDSAKKGIIGFDEWAPVNAEALAIASPDYRPRFPDWREYGDRVGIALQSVIAGETDAKSAFDDAQKELESLMKDKGYI
jgi:ABC-type glycerol-3-phosphate transport system substrate-binding protein